MSWRWISKQALLILHDERLATLTVRGVAAGDVSEAEFAQWLRTRLAAH